MFFQEINNFLKIIRETISFKLESVGQNHFSGLHAKKSGVIFFQPKLLDPKHSDPGRLLREGPGPGGRLFLETSNLDN